MNYEYDTDTYSGSYIIGGGIYNYLGFSYASITSNNTFYFEAGKDYYIIVEEYGGQELEINFTLEYTDLTVERKAIPDIRIKIREDEDEFSYLYAEDLKNGKLSGVTWDPETATLILDNAKISGCIYFEDSNESPRDSTGVTLDITDVENTDINVVVKGNNTINPNGGIEKVVDEDTLLSVYGFIDTAIECWNPYNLKISGDGVINFESYCAIYADGILTIDGPTINMDAKHWWISGDYIYASRIEVKSGTVEAVMYPRKSDADRIYPSLLYCRTMKISGGTFICKYVDLETENEGALGYSPFDTDLYIEVSNATVIIQGNEKMLSELETFNVWDRSKGVLNVDKETVTVLKGEKIDITKLKATLSQEKYIYDGKEKKPDVDVAGLREGTDYTVSYKNNVNIGKATVTVTGKDIFTGSITLEFEILPDGPVAGKVVKDKKYIYKVTKAGNKDGSVVGQLQVTGLKKKSLKQIKIAAKVTIGGVKYKVTSIGAKAFKGNKKITKATIGKNVKTIGANAFANCKKLKQVTINSTALKSIGKNAFKGDKKLSKIIIKSTKLKKLGKNSLKGTSKKLVVKVPKKKKKAYKKLVKKAGNKKASVK